MVMRNHSVLLLAYHFPPAITSGATRADRFAKYLQRFGYDIQVVCEGEGQNGCERGYVRRVPGGAKYSALVEVLSWIMRALQGSVKAYGWRLQWVPYATAMGARSMSSKPVVISTFPPLATHIGALYLKWRYGLKWIADFRDPMLWHPTLDSRRFWHARLERMVLRYSDVTIANTDAAAEAWRTQYPQWADKIRVIWNGFDPEEAIEAVSIPLREHKVLAHVGEIYGMRHPGAILESFDRLVSKGSLNPRKYQIQLIGPIDTDSATFGYPSFHRLVARGCLECTSDLIPRQEALRAARQSDFLLLLDIALRENGVQVPAKLFDYLRIGHPILAITTQDSPTERILSQSGVPYLCIYPQDSETEIDRKLLTFLNLPSEAVRASEWFWTKFDGVRQVEMLASIIDGLSESGGLAHAAGVGSHSGDLS